MKLRLQLAKQQRDDLVAIVAIPDDRFEAAVSALQARSYPTVRPGALRSALADSGLSQDEAAVLTRQALSLRSIVQRRLVTPEETSEAVVAAWDYQPTGGEHEAAEANEKLQKRLTSLLTTEAVAVASKALQLSFDYVNTLDNLRILTDVRPVFSESQDKLVGGIISQVLRVDYLTDDGPHTISIASNAKDIESLRDACDAAIKKARQLKVHLSREHEDRVFLSGEENHDPDES
jgi:hypothetical protein